jgi:hypothetical protein
VAIGDHLPIATLELVWNSGARLTGNPCQIDQISDGKCTQNIRVPGFHPLHERIGWQCFVIKFLSHAMRHP